MNRYEITAAAALVVGLAGAAQADAIDGDWCHRDGRRLSIRGPQIVTPGQNRIEGQYDRHHFSYAIPSGEPGTGQTTFMILLSEYVMHLRVGERPTGADPTDEWRRCAPGVS